MEPFEFHLFVCDQRKPEGVPCCSARGSGSVLAALRREVARQGLMDCIQITPCGSLGLCESGPNMLVYPEGIWYCGVTEKDVPEIVGCHFKEGIVVERLARLDPSSLRAEILSNRARMQAALQAREAAGSLPEELLKIIRGYQESRVILTAVELDLFSAVGSGATAATLANRLKTGVRASGMLLDALVAMGMLQKQADLFRNTALSARYFVADSSDNARAAILHSAQQWQLWTTLTDCVRAGTSVSYKEAAERGEKWTEAFIAAMDHNARERAPLVVSAVGTAGIEKMLDVGGGSGAYSIAFARAGANLKAVVFDLPSVVGIAQSHIEQAGLADRVQTRAGDIRSDAFGEGYNLVLVSSICHMLSPEANRDLLKKCYLALEPEGLLVIQDFILDPDRTTPKFAALFALNMLVSTRAGNAYIEQEYASWLEQAGFHEVRRLRLPGSSGLMLASRP